MQQDDDKKFVDVMRYLSLNFTERTITPDLMRSYFNDLFEYSVDDIWKAAKAHVRISDKFPLVSDFIRLLSA